MSRNPVVRCALSGALAASLVLCVAGPASAASATPKPTDGSQTGQARLLALAQTPGAELVGIKEASFSVNPNTGEVKQVLAGTYSNSYVTVGVGTVRISNTPGNYSWIVQGWIQTNGESGANAITCSFLVCGEDHLSIGWGRSIAMVGDSVSGYYYGGSRILSARNQANPLAGVDYSFIQRYSRPFNYFVVSAQIKELALQNLINNAQVMWTHTYNGIRVSVSIGASVSGPSFGVSATDYSSFYTRSAFSAFTV